MQRKTLYKKTPKKSSLMF